jgi:hypothetical protein
MPKARMRFPVTLVRSLSLIFQNLQERLAQLWNSDRPRHAWDWMETRAGRISKEPIS